MASPHGQGLRDIRNAKWLYRGLVTPMNAMFPMPLGENEIIGLGGAGVWHMNIPNPIGWMADFFPWPF